MITVYKITYDGTSYIDANLGNIKDMVSDLETGDSITITKLQMEESDYKKLPEFQGF